jgi:hypothetical protein
MQQISRKFKSEAMTNAKTPHSNVVQGFVEVARMDSFSYDLIKQLLHKTCLVKISSAARRGAIGNLHTQT